MWKPLGAACALIALASLPARAEAPKVVASIQPLHSLAAAVMKGAGTPELLVSGSRSEHTFSLKPSDARKLAAAHLVVLVDEHYEAFMAKPLAGMKGKAEIVAMADLPGMTVLAPRQGGVWEPEHGDHDHDHHRDHGAMDGHLWLDPANAKVLVTALAAKLAALDPTNAPLYAANATEIAARLDALDLELRARLAPVAGKPYVVFHDAYQYFEARYGLAAAGSITVDPDRPPSARRMASLRDRLKQGGAACVFREPQFPAKTAEALASAAGAGIGSLDPQGASIPPGPDLYFRLMTGLADGLTGCLAGR
ncbi:zinc ABC transporter substrate-binding protein [Magnetospirillum sp. UT-4]|uniref:zinc ABC transporter substrate-binding protein n=1 Tax=Magnetospirillum sp. UT-4 TaxID=2681467 RepID=UPI0013816F71|nr:zinc ABC transporter substrate-binding protein [Magnetospirillum sp. UT-4]CAA7620257.1 High-affinity zinc uptake system protein ZnuA [Magnetospirillum sp. UT-4]